MGEDYIADRSPKSTQAGNHLRPTALPRRFFPLGGAGGDHPIANGKIVNGQIPFRIHKVALLETIFVPQRYPAVTMSLPCDREGGPLPGK